MPQMRSHLSTVRRRGEGEMTEAERIAQAYRSRDEGMAASVAGEIQRVMRPGGGLLWYDFRYDSPSNPNVRGVGARRVRSLFPNLTGELIGLTLLPPLARRLGPLTPAAYPVLVTIPPLRSHLCGLLRNAASCAPSSCRSHLRSSARKRCTWEVGRFVASC